MNIPDELLLSFFQHVEPEKLLLLYQVNRRCRRIVQDLFLRCNQLPSCKLSTSSSDHDVLMNAAWRYMAPCTATAIQNIGFKSQTVLYKSTEKKHCKRIHIIYPPNAIVFSDRKLFDSCTNSVKFLYDEHKNMLIDGHMPGSRSGNTCIHQIRVHSKHIVEKEQDMLYPCYIFINERGRIITCNYSPDHTFVYRVNVPEVSNIKTWITALSNRLLHEGAQGPHLFMCGRNAVGFRILQKNDAVPERVFVYTIPTGFPVKVKQQRSSDKGVTKKSVKFVKTCRTAITRNKKRIMLTNTFTFLY